MEFAESGDAHNIRAAGTACYQCSAVVDPSARVLCCKSPGVLHLHHAEYLQHWSDAFRRIHRLVVVQVQHLPCGPAKLLSELQALLQAQLMFREARRLVCMALLLAEQCKCV